MSRKRKLLKRAVQVKEHVSKVAVRKLQIRSFQNFCKLHRKTSVLESLFNKVAGLKARNPIKKRLQYRYFPVKFAKSQGAPFFTEQLQWLLLRFNSCFQRSLGQKLMQLSPINTRSSWKKVSATIGVLWKKACNFKEKKAPVLQNF